ncbi:MAG TPA: metal ABC transporter permease, partial [bacterium]|nr:metal ABC transporter permease [bacterium]
NAVFAALLASVLCGISGTFVFVNRITFIAGGIAHAVLGGVGAAVYFGFPPFSGAVAAALVFALVLGIIKFKASQHEDTVIGALWALGMSVGIIFIYLTPGYSVNLLSYLFGNILLVSTDDIVVLAVLGFAVITVAAVLYRQLKSVSFDLEFSILRGVKGFAVYTMMLVMIALTVVVLMKIVGLILVIAFLSLPAATAAVFTKRMGKIIVVSSVLSFIFSFSGLFVSYNFDLPTGATITAVAVVIYLLSIISGRYYGKLFK